MRICFSALTVMAAMAAFPTAVPGQTSAAPVFSNLTEPKAQLWNANFTVVDGNAVIVDQDSQNFQGGGLIVRVLNGVSSDRLSIRSRTVEGGINISGTDVRILEANQLISIGTIVNPIPVSGATLLRVTLKVTATPPRVTTLLRNITYRNITNSPVTVNRTLQFKALDGDGGVTSYVNKIVRIGSLNGSYSGSFVGQLNAGGVPDTIPGNIIGPNQNFVETTINGTAVNVSLPALNATGQGTISSTGTFSATSSGTIAGLGVNVQFIGTVKLNANGSASGSGTWSIINSQGVTGSGTWTISRTAP